jgi:hypothetical protein
MYVKKIHLVATVGGIHVHPRKDFPTFSNKSKQENISPGTPIHTTQEQFSNEVVDKYRKQIRTGERPIIRVGRSASGQLWLYNGHHRYIAYRLEGIKQIPVHVHEAGTDMGGEQDAPKFRRKPPTKKRAKRGRYAAAGASGAKESSL